MPPTTILLLLLLSLTPHALSSMPCLENSNCPTGLVCNSRSLCSTAVQRGHACIDSPDCAPGLVCNISVCGTHGRGEGMGTWTKVAIGFGGLALVAAFFALVIFCSRLSDRRSAAADRPKTAADDDNSPPVPV